MPETKRVDRAEGGIEAEGISKEIPMLPLLKRHQIQVLIGAGHSQNEAAELAKVSVRSVKRVATKTAVHHVDDAAPRRQRAIGRPSNDVLVKLIRGGIRVPHVVAQRRRRQRAAGMADERMAEAVEGPPGRHPGRLACPAQSAIQCGD